MSTGRSADLVRKAKEAGIRVTCEVTPHHVALTHEAVGSYETHAKMNPPLRPESDRQALLAALADGTIDAIATDHAPHHADEKCVEFSARRSAWWARDRRLDLFGPLGPRRVIGLSRWSSFCQPDRLACCVSRKDRCAWGRCGHHRA
jgi:dihydroorotase